MMVARRNSKARMQANARSLKFNKFRKSEKVIPETILTKR